MLILLRSLIFNVLFYLALIGLLIIAIPTFVLPRGAIIEVAKTWGRVSNWLLRVVCGIRIEIEGREKIPQGPLLVASKHQSIWETFALMPLFDDPTFILKRELQWIPFFGWYTIKGRMVPVDRGAGASALIAMAKRAHDVIATGRQLIIFPEGTRRPPHAEPRYKYGIVQLYAECEVACLPIALNSGLFWPRRTFLRYPGTIRARILDPIPPGLAKDEFFTTLRARLEAASEDLLAQGERELRAAGIEREVPAKDAEAAPKS